MQAILSKAKSPNLFLYFHPGFSRRSSIRLPLRWIAALVLAVVDLAGCGIACNALSMSIAPSSVYSGATEGSDAAALTVMSDVPSGLTTVSSGGSGAASTRPQLTASPIALDFGNVPLNVASALPLTLTSSGTAPVTISAATLSGTGFTGSSNSAVSLPLTLNPNQSVTLQMQFVPRATGSASGQLTFTSNSATGGTTQVQLSGTGTVATSSRLTVSTNLLSFGNVRVNSTTTLPVTLTSSGTAPVTISAATLSGTGFTGSSNSAVSLPLTLNPNQSVTLQMQFVPRATGSASGQLTFTSNSATGRTTQVQLSGTGTVATSSRLTVSTNFLSFGNVRVNSTTTLPLTLTSSGTAPVTISAATLSGTGFTSSGASLPVRLNPNQSVTLGVQFGPTTAGGITGQLAITSDSSTGAMTIVQLSGTGTTATTPQLQFSSTALSFGNVPVGSTATLSLTLISSGTAPVTVNTAGLTGTGFSNSGTSFPVVLNPDQSVTLELQFDPTAATAATGQLTIKSDSTTGSTTQISLSGTGTAVQHAIDLTWDAPSTSPDPVAGYNVFRSIDNGTSFTKVNSSLGAQTDYADTVVQSGATYIYQVTSVDASGTESSPSNQISLTVP
jgi:hypothetical protein